MKTSCFGLRMMALISWRKLKNEWIKSCYFHWLVDLNIHSVYFTYGSVYLHHRKCNIYFPSFTACSLEILFSMILFSRAIACSLEILFFWVVLESAWAGFLTQKRYVQMFVWVDLSDGQVSFGEFLTEFLYELREHTFHLVSNVFL